MSTYLPQQHQLLQEWSTWQALQRMQRQLNDGLCRFDHNKVTDMQLQLKILNKNKKPATWQIILTVLRWNGQNEIF